MPDNQTLNQSAALQISYIHPSRPIWPAITPRWLLNVLPFVSIESGVYRVNQVISEFELATQASPGKTLPTTFGDYKLTPKEFHLRSIQTNLRLSIISGDLYNAPHNQLKEQTRLIVEALREEEELQILTNPDWGLANAADKSMKLNVKGPPTPDAMDDLLALVWEKPAFFVAHPEVVAAFGKECSARGFAPDTVGMFGAPFLTWRGVPILPSNKLAPSGKSKRSSILLMRVGEPDQGVIGVNQIGIPGEIEPGLSMRFNGIDAQGCSNYLFVLYFAVTVLSPSALGVMECSV
jgi:hypothetical protein